MTYDEISKSGATCLALFTHCIGAAGGEEKEGRGRQFYKGDLISPWRPRWRRVPLILSLFSPGDRSMSGLPALPRGGEAASLWCYSLVPGTVSCRSSQVPLLPWLFPSTHKMLKINAKWNFPAAWRRRVFCSFCIYIQLAHSWYDLRSWIEYRCHAQSQQMGWGWRETLWRKDCQGSQEPRLPDLA